MRRGQIKGATLAPLLALALTAGILVGCSQQSGPSASPVVGRFLSDWAAQHYGAMAKLVHNPPANLSSQLSGAVKALPLKSASYKPGAVTTRGSRASVRVTQQLVLSSFGTFEVHSRLNLELFGKRWKVLWSPASINPAFGAKGHYSADYIWPPRAPVLAANGTPISAAVPRSVVIGLEGSYIKDATTLASSLERAGASAAQTESAIAAAQSSPSSFQPVFTVSWTRYEQLKGALYPVPGVFFQAKGGGGSTPSELVGVVGTLGVITKAELKSLGPPYTATSTVGQGGIEQAFERQLAGTPSLAIAVAGGKTAKVLKRFKGRPGRPVHTTIDLTAEQDAASALAASPDEAALVAIKASTGQIIAAANTSQGSDLALDGAQPPGSTMKVLTSTALIDKGLTPSSAASCPPTINVDGEVLHNAEGEAPVSNLYEAFTESCNTAFIGLTMANLGFKSLHQAALSYRVGTNFNIGAIAYNGSVPISSGQTDLAASAIGQARVLMSPLDLAMVAADLDTGVVRTPYISPSAPAARAPKGKVPAKVDRYLRQMMLSVVERGTAANTGLPPGTYAKTGTAEYGTGNPLPIDAWLMGFHGDIAFCMVTINSPKEGGPEDGPIVARFFSLLGTHG